MKEIEVEIEGITPLLMNSPKAMLEPEPEIKQAKKKYIPEEEAEKVAYRNAQGKLFVPSTAIKGSMVNAAAYKKAGKYTLRPLIAGGVRIKGFEIILDTQEYEIDARTVVIQRNRVLKWRPRINKWKLKFVLIYNDKLLSPNPIQTCLIEAGERVGILDFRPQKLGEFGMFKVTKFEEIK